ncbi:hypothetical protein [Marilutibacter alkalisoli]|uniref:Uncharacterized protein n=1 Tax=Marilutibacter alkalisoli TaxID=2591633 RepID=A0A514BVT2_9GAMM|nr:hypothetical protein [Lysobacter alkalisoli]QDH71486.1 hypothetical protein FKV23_16350 [Lysobacter alkalisoli]
MRTLILCMALSSVVVFGGAFVASFLNPVLVERLAREVVRIEVEKRVGERLDSLSNARLVGFAQKALRKTDEEIAVSTSQIRDGVPRAVATVVADMLDADCECRKRMIAYAERGANEQLSSLGRARERLTQFIEATYTHVTTSLMREFRVFTAANAVVFLFLAGVAFRRRRAAPQLVLPAVVLIGAATLTAALYLFGQNWLHTIIFSNYVGLAYFAYLAMAVALLSDVAFNRARVCTWLLNQATSAVGSALHFAPC